MLIISLLGEGGDLVASRVEFVQQGAQVAGVATGGEGEGQRLGGAVRHRVRGAGLQAGQLLRLIRAVKT